MPHFLDGQGNGLDSFVPLFNADWAAKHRTLYTQGMATGVIFAGELSRLCLVMVLQ